MYVRKLGLLTSAFLLWAVGAFAEDLPRVSPEAAGISSTKLRGMKPVVQAMLDKKETAGVVIAVVRNGKVADLEPFGLMDIEAAKPMQTDAIFRIYSMSKPITSVAVMMLCEEGRFQLDEPVSKYLPELKGLRVQAEKGNETTEAKREITIRDLLRHTSGFTYGFFGDSPVDKLYRDNKVLDPNDSLADLVTKLGKLPLAYQPGTHFNYSVSTDVLGRLVEVVSGKSLDQFFQERIFGPLDMKDTGFFVPDEKLPRFTACYGPVEKGSGLKVTDAPANSKYRKPPKLLSGGGGLVSTARDYCRFCEMMLEGGQLGGTRLLREDTVQQMMSNQLPDEAMPINLGGAPRPGVGFGLGFSVAIASREYGWGGAASTHFWIAPKQKLAVVALQQYMPFHQRLEFAIKPIIYGAIEK
jgi:CubicO group peptidase (beta-lactamase class C family)